MKDTPSLVLSEKELVGLRHVVARQEITDCLNKVSRGMDRFDRELYLSAFHDDAVIDAGSLVGSPATAYDSGAELHAHGQSSTLHHLLNHSCEIEGDTAHSETYFFFVGRNRDETNWAAGGRYADRLERRDGTWKIALRCTVLEWSGTLPSANVPLFDNVPDLHLNGTPSRSKEDLTYLRPLTNRREMTNPADLHALSRPRE